MDAPFVDTLLVLLDPRNFMGFGANWGNSDILEEIEGNSAEFSGVWDGA